ncbi:MAG: DNA methyltransferase [Chloroflexi bacterium]|nr:DNA methyltransferase [Chloroflexota bacterium]MCY4247427.1 DNA methyltransferase [Chloroflexota bacterium]
MKPNFRNQTVWTGDCLDIMRGTNSECVDLICLDPPFNSNANYAAPIGSQAAGAEFKDTWTLSDIDAEWINLIESKHAGLHRVLLAAMTDSDKSYLVYMAVRLLEMRRILKPTGSLFLHCDPTMSHYLKLVMDAIFGRGNFRNEIIWHYSGWNKQLKAHIERRHDVILFYSKADGAVFNPPARTWESKEEYIKVRKQKVRVDEDGREYVLSDGGGGRRARRYLDEAMRYGIPLDDVWDIPKLNNSDKERTGYPTQKPLALYRRLIAAGSDEGALVLDPFCGCATTCIAAQGMGRQWVGIDVAGKATELTKLRLREELGLFSNPIHRADMPRRTDLGGLPRPASHKKALYGEQAGNCAGCGEHFQSQRLEVDHIIPRSKGGTDHSENLQLLCGSCNRIKGNRGMEYLRVKLQLR